MQPPESLLDFLGEWSAAIAIALVGGLAKLLHSGEVLTARKVVAALLTSGFCAVLVALALGERGVARLTIAAAIGMSGWAGPALLPHATDRLKKTIDRILGKEDESSSGGSNA